MSYEVHHLNEIWDAAKNEALEIFKNDHIQIGILLLTPNTRLPETGFSVHENFHEFAYIIDGEVIFGTPKKTTYLKAGDFMYNRPGTPHYTENASDVSAKILWFLVPDRV